MPVPAGCPVRGWRGRGAGCNAFSSGEPPNIHLGGFNGKAVIIPHKRSPDKSPSGRGATSFLRPCAAALGGSASRPPGSSSAQPQKRPPRVPREEPTRVTWKARTSPGGRRNSLPEAPPTATSLTSHWLELSHMLMPRPITGRGGPIQARARPQGSTWHGAGLVTTRAHVRQKWGSGREEERSCGENAGLTRAGGGSGWPPVAASPRGEQPGPGQRPALASEGTVGASAHRAGLWKATGGKGGKGHSPQLRNWGRRR